MKTRAKVAIILMLAAIALNAYTQVISGFSLLSSVAIVLFVLAIAVLAYQK
jgi:hypothetical protein